VLAALRELGGISLRPLRSKALKESSYREVREGRNENKPHRYRREGWLVETGVNC
jgi:hypothetical protein